MKGSRSKKGDNGKPLWRLAAPRLANVSAKDSRGDHRDIGFQQSLIDLFRYLPIHDSPDLQKTVQKVKAHLYHRHFEDAFGKEDYREAYAARWSPSRALAYASVLQKHLGQDWITERASNHTILNSSEPSHQADHFSMVDNLPGTAERKLKVTCLGGGPGGELVGLAGWTSRLAGGSVEKSSPRRPQLQISILDVADWSKVLGLLEESVSKAPSTPKDASGTAKEAAVPLPQADEVVVSFHQCDLLDLSVEEMTPHVQGSSLVTLMFTLNELYSASVARTTRFLSQLSACVDPGATLMVVDSPGSYSSVAVGKNAAGEAKNRYPTQWLLDHTLLGSGSKADGDIDSKWEKLAGEDSSWFRLPEGLRYPIPLESMRYQVHLYQRL